MPIEPTRLRGASRPKYRFETTSVCNGSQLTESYENTLAPFLIVVAEQGDRAKQTRGVLRCARRVRLRRAEADGSCGQRGCLPSFFFKGALTWTSCDPYPARAASDGTRWDSMGLRVTPPHSGIDMLHAAPGWIPLLCSHAHGFYRPFTSRLLYRPCLVPPSFFGHDSPAHLNTGFAPRPPRFLTERSLRQKKSTLQPTTDLLSTTRPVP